MPVCFTTRYAKTREIIKIIKRIVVFIPLYGGIYTTKTWQMRSVYANVSITEIYLNQIDRTTLWCWKMEPDDNNGKELSNIEVLEEFISRTETQNIMRTYLKVAFALSAILGKMKRIFQVLINDHSSFALTVQR
jgi:hypothetical protein